MMVLGSISVEGETSQVKNLLNISMLFSGRVPKWLAEEGDREQAKFR